MENKNENKDIKLMEVLDKLEIKEKDTILQYGAYLLKHVLGPKLEELILSRFNNKEKENKENKFFSYVICSTALEINNIGDSANANEKLSYFSKLAKTIKTAKDDSVKNTTRTAICAALYMDAIAKLGKHYEDKLTEVGLKSMSLALEEVLNCKDTDISTSHKFAFLVIIGDLLQIGNIPDPLWNNAVDFICTELEKKFPFDLNSKDKVNSDNEKFQSQIIKILDQIALGEVQKGLDPNETSKALAKKSIPIIGNSLTENSTEESIKHDNINGFEKELGDFINFVFNAGIPYDKKKFEKLLDSKVKISEKKAIINSTLSQIPRYGTEKEGIGSLFYILLLKKILQKNFNFVMTKEQTEEYRCRKDMYRRFQNLVENYAEETIGDGDCFYWALVNILNLKKNRENMTALKKALLEFYNNKTSPKDKEAIGILSEKEDFL